MLQDQPLLVTEYVTPVPQAQRRAAIVDAGGLRALGWLLGRLHSLDDAPGRAGGAWHHLADDPRAEIAAPRDLVAGAASSVPARGARHYDAMRDAVEGLDTGHGLTAAFTHPDFVMANVVAPGDGRMVLVDWSGAGRAPGCGRWASCSGPSASAATSLASTAPSTPTAAGCRPSPEELARLDTLVAARACAAFAAA